MTDKKVWLDAKKKYHLSADHIRMARELGLNPKKLGGLENSGQEKWKSSLPRFIEEMYHKRLRKIENGLMR